MSKKSKIFTVQIEPEEILLDKESASKLEMPLKKTRGVIIFFIAFIILFSFLSRAFWLQIWQGDYYANRAIRNNVRLYPIQAPRGLIYDRNNKLLLDNTADFNLLLVPADIPKENETLKNWVKELSKISNKREDEIFDFLKTISVKSTEPVLFSSNLNKDELIAIETKLRDTPGIFIRRETKRDYFEKYYFSHLLGYLGKVSRADLKSDSFYTPLNFIGKTGLEMQYENNLRGKSGKTAVIVDSDNTVLNILTAEEPKPGNNLTLSIDKDLQKLLTDALTEKMADTISPAAAAVVINPKSGAILSLVSLPSFDSNLFNSNLSDKTYGVLANDKKRPFFNRAIGGAYASGSTIKPFMAAAALNENIVSPEYKIDDTLGYITIPNQYDPNVSYVFHDWKAHGFVDMRRAIAVSANVYFYVIGGGYKNIKGLGIDRIDKYFKLFGFGSSLGIDLPGETSGLVPNPTWKKSVKNESWFTGDTYNVSIGQGDVLITPLQLAAAISVIANNGILYKPKIVSKITDTNGNTLEKFEPEIIRNINIDKEKLQIVREGMRGAVTEGSAYLLNDLLVKVAGKTGTAQVTNTFRKTNAWFTGFAPYDNPEIALAIIIEGAGEGSSAAVPVAKRVFEWYYNSQQNVLK
ncbi:MAG: penicillin-binding protein 2 [Candidatus Azambacteria bacterium]|nr:penicillin-binding protein 2 [Candidatus Azambacteria bacterium]